MGHHSTFENSSSGIVVTNEDSTCTTTMGRHERHLSVDDSPPSSASNPTCSEDQHSSNEESEQDTYRDTTISSSIEEEDACMLDTQDSEESPPLAYSSSPSKTKSAKRRKSTIALNPVKVNCNAPSKRNSLSISSSKISSPLLSPMRQLLTEEEHLLVANIKQFIHQHYQHDINVKRLRRRMERIEYHRITGEMYKFLNEKRKRIAAHYMKTFRIAKSSVHGSQMLQLTDYALQEFVFSDVLSSICMASIRTRISFLEDHQIIQQCESMREKSLDFFDIEPSFHTADFRQAINQLDSIESLSTPCQMQRCISKTIRAISDSLELCCQNRQSSSIQQQKDAVNSSRVCISADDLLPIIIYVIVQSQTLQNPLLIIEYINELSHHQGRDSYDLVLFESAVHAIKSGLVAKAAADG